MPTRKKPARHTLLFVTSLTIIALLVSACGQAAGDVGETPATTTTRPSVATTVLERPGLVISPTGGVNLYERPAGSVLYTAAETLVFPVTDMSGLWLQVIDTCGREAWVARDEADLVFPASPQTPGSGFDISASTVVVDAGHGGRDLGAKGATGTWESHVNLLIAHRLEELMSSGHTIDWETGRISPGADYPAFGTVWMTRDQAGPLDGDVEMSLGYRAEYANGAGADAIVSLHNNSSPGTTITTPGSDVFYSVNSPDSDRLGSLIHEELLRSLGPLGDEFGAGRINGVKTRVDTETGDDFYGLLRRAEPPAVIVEGLYISEPAEEAILWSDAGQQAYADAVYRGLVRFLTTDGYGSEVHEPTPFDGDVGTVTNTACVVPTQP